MTDTHPHPFDARYAESLVINGHKIFVSGFDLPHDIVQLAEHAVSEYAEKHGEREMIELGDLTAVPWLDGVWRIVDKHSGMPQSPKVDAEFTLKQLISRFREPH